MAKKLTKPQENALEFLRAKREKDGPDGRGWLGVGGHTPSRFEVPHCVAFALLAKDLVEVKGDMFLDRGRNERARGRWYWNGVVRLKGERK